MALNPFTVLMSAVCTDKKNVGDLTCFTFEQKIPVQSYLIAFAVGLLESRQIGPRSKVWAEKEVVDAAAFEFANTEEQLRVAEEICGKYVWGIYDILVLPPSFPFGGMENPCLTFATPTLLVSIFQEFFNLFIIFYSFCIFVKHFLQLYSSLKNILYFLFYSTGWRSILSKRYSP